MNRTPKPRRVGPAMTTPKAKPTHQVSYAERTVACGDSPSIHVHHALGPVKRDRVDVAIGRIYFDGDHLVIEAGLEFIYPKLRHFATPPLFRHKIPLKSFRQAAKGWHRAVDQAMAKQGGAPALPVEGL